MPGAPETIPAKTPEATPEATNVSVEKRDSAARKKKAHAIALFSGGLDSALAMLLLLRQNIEVTALTFMTHFGCDATSDRSSCGSNPYPMAEKFGFNVKLMHLGQRFIDIVEKPKYGRGANMNVCIDCRILMIDEAARYMRMTGADFIVTGEVVGQRPMSQRKPTMGLVEKRVNLGGRLLRPLSARILPPTLPEKQGLVDREKLEGISGRTRKRQMELAREFGLDDYPSPASGCLLTDFSYSQRLRDLMKHSDRLTFQDLNLLRIGRQFRISPACKLIVGRNENENKQLQQYANSETFVLEAIDTGSPLGLLYGSPTDEELTICARILARYCDRKHLAETSVQLRHGGSERTLTVAPADEATLDRMRIQ
ncbi:MAG: hypothetical protein ACE5GA_05125 [Candidatus Zixiibacteriota bacterium]